MCSKRSDGCGREKGTGFRPLTAAQTDSLLEWYEREKRTLPWRTDPTPYHVWVSEIMLQQTRVEAVLRYYERFLKAFPDVASLAESSEEKLMKLWEGLGYYSRAKQMRKAAVILCERFGGELPADPAVLRTLPGIGPYTAGAIASIAFGLPEPAVDGNVLRVLARTGGCDEDIREEKTRREAESTVRSMIPKDRAGTFTQALMELGALVCVPNGEAKCGACPLRDSCEANLRDLVDSLPVRSENAPRKAEDRTVLILLEGDRVCLRKRPPKGLLAGLYELPNECGTLSQDEATAFAKRQGFQPLRLERLPEAVHIFTHREWHMSGWLMTGYFDPSLSPEARPILSGRRELDETYAVPSAFSAYLRILRERLPQEAD